MMIELTKDRVERAIVDTKRQLKISDSNIEFFSGNRDKKEWLIEEEIAFWENAKDVCLTQLAALDAVRWRDAETEWPEEEMYMVAEISFLSAPRVVYKPEKGEYVQLPDSYGVEYSRSVIKKYLPLPKWKEEA